MPRLDAPKDAPLSDIPGTVPPPWAWPPGCAFHPRCPVARAECSSPGFVKCPETAGGPRREKVALVGDVALELIAPYFREAGFDTYVPPGFGAWRQELLDGSSGLMKSGAGFVFDVTAHDAALSAEDPAFFDGRMKAVASMPYSLSGIRAIVEEFEFRRLASPRKVLAVDADNTLWRGILSEDGADALEPCVEFQKGLLELRDEGVLLVLLSKNDPASPFIRPGMPLTDGDFAAVKAGWSPKAGNLVEACRELNVGLDSVVFVDDNPSERAQMAAHLPEVAVAPWRGWSGDISRGPLEARRLLRRLRECFFSDMGRTAEDRLRAASYAARARASAVMPSFRSAGEYLDYLDLRAEARPACGADLDRLAQMAGKTNQFNATTIRRTRADFEKLLSDTSKRVFVFRASDRFGDQGTVCYIVADVALRRITDFVMSCRVMGRTLEHFAYAHVARELGFRPEIDFTPSLKNRPFADFLSSLDRAAETRYRDAGACAP